MKKLLALMTLTLALTMFGPGVLTPGPAAAATVAHKTAAQVSTAVKNAAAAPPAKEKGSANLLLQPEPGMIVWTLVIFLLMLVVLGKWVWPPILNALQDREAKIRNDFEEAEHAAEEAKQTLEQYQTQLAEARREAQQIIEKSRGDAKRLAQQLKEKTQEDLVQMRRRMDADMEAAKEQAISEVYEQTAMIATRVASRILDREINPQDQRDLVDRSLKEFQTLNEN